MSSAVFAGDGALVGVLDGAAVRDVGLRLGLTGARQVVARTFKERSANAWLRARDGGTPVFVKLFARPDRARVERLALGLLPPSMAPELLRAGHLDDVGAYCVYRWEDLARDPAWDDHVTAAGSLLAEVHAVDIAAEPGLPRRPVDAIELAEQLDELAREAPDAHAELRRRLPGAEVRRIADEALEAEREGAPVLLHGDFSLRNVALAGGRWLVHDLERARIGAAELDLERIWDRELSARPAGHARFLAAYRAAAGWPRPELLRFARLQCAVSTILAARRTDDEQFEQEGLRMLRASSAP